MFLQYIYSYLRKLASFILIQEGLQVATNLGVLTFTIIVLKITLKVIKSIKFNNKVEPV